MRQRGKWKCKGKGKMKVEEIQQTHLKNTTTTASASTSASNPNGAAARYLPDHIISEIFLRLPVNSVLRFRCLSKYWYEFLTNPDFIAEHHNNEPPEALIHAIGAPIAAVNGGPQPHQPYGHVMYKFRRLNPGEPSSIYRIPFPLSGAVGYLNVVGITQNGVVCIVQHILALNFTLWNPATGSVLSIPVPESPNPGAVIGAASAGFGFDPSRGEFVIIRIVRFYEDYPYTDIAQLFNFQSGRWDVLPNNFYGRLPFWFLLGTCEAVVNDVPYWRVMVHNELGLKLVWFDMRRRAFVVEQLPEWSTMNKNVVMGEIREGYFGAIVVSMEYPCIFEVWTRDGGWGRTYRIDLWQRRTMMRLVGFYGDAEIVEEIFAVEDGNPYLCMLVKLDGFDVLFGLDQCCLEGAFLGTCRMMRYRKSLTAMPRIGN